MKFPVEVTENSILDHARLEVLRDFIIQTENVPGDIAEVGVYRGGTGYLLRHYAGPHRSVFLFDTFAGMPEPKRGVDTHSKGDFSDTSEAHVRGLFLDSEAVYIYKGVFPYENSGVVDKRNFSFVHLDCDIFASVNDGLEFFWPRMSPGGIIVLDDYNAATCPGAKLATDQFFKNKMVEIGFGANSQAFVEKP